MGRGVAMKSPPGYGTYGTHEKPDGPELACHRAELIPSSNEIGKWGARFARRPPFGVPIFFHCLMVSAQLYGMPAQAHLAFSWVPWGTHEKQGVPRDVSKDPPTANLANLFFLSEATFCQRRLFFRGDIFETTIEMF